MRILHTSDLHGGYKRVLSYQEDFDVWVDTGDFMRDGPMHAWPPSHTKQAAWQKSWAESCSLGPRLKDWLDGRPVVVCPGNHDFWTLGAVLANAGVTQAAVMGPGYVAGVEGLRWAGFGHINYIAGSWPRELSRNEMAPLVRQVLNHAPDILVTHSPPAGILDCGWGLAGLAETKAQLHLFGHVHEHGGELYQGEQGTKHYNGSQRMRVIDV